MKPLMLALLLLAAPLANAADALTEQNIRAMYGELIAAAAAKDIEGVLSHMSEDVRISIETPSEMGGNMEMDRRQYRDLLTQGWDGVEDYRLEADIHSIEIAADGQTAKVVDLTTESMHIQGMPVKASTLETATLQLIDGKPRFSRIDGVIQP